MKFLNSDFWVVTISSALITTFSLFLYLDFTSRVQVAEAKEIGVITFKKKVAQRKYQGQVIWEDVEQRATVFNNDSIRTADLSDAVIHLHDGTEINVSENSLILLSLARNTININFAHGSISANRGKGVAGEIEAVQITSKDATVSLKEESDVSVSTMGEDKMNLTVAVGIAEVTVGNTRQIVEKDQKAIVTPREKDVRIVKLEIPLLGPEQNSIFVTNKKKYASQFRWKPIDKNFKVFFELSKSHSFAARDFEQETTGQQMIYALPEGSYFWRLRAKHKKTGQEEFSEARKIMVLRDQPLQLIYPENRERIEYTVAPPLINFRWGQNVLASGYTLEISNSRTFEKIITTRRSLLSSLAIDTLPAGTYYWRVRSRPQIPRLDYENVSPVYMFGISKEKVLEPPALLTPEKNEQIGLAKVKQNDLLFSWRDERKIGKYEITIARDKDFSSQLLSSITTQNIYRLTKEIPEGAYYWRVRSLGSNDLKSSFSTASRFSVIPTGSIKLVAPAAETNFVLEEGKKSLSSLFRWEKSPVKGKYQFELAKDANFLAPEQRRILNMTSLRVKSLKPGHYFWRVKVLDRDRNEIVASPVLGLYVTKKGTEPEIASVAKTAVPPKEDIVKETDQPKKVDETKARLTITSPVKNSYVYVDTRLVGRRKKQVEVEVEPDIPVAIEIKAAGYHSYKKEITLEKGEAREVVATLERLKLLSRVRWNRDLKYPVVQKPMLYQNMLLLSTKKGTLTSMDRNGTMLWNKSFKEGFQSTPSVYGNRVYLVTLEGKFISLYLSNGEQYWKKQVNGPLLFGATPVIAGKMVYLATSFGSVYGFTLKGKKVWEKNLGEGIFTSVAYHKHTVFVATEGARVVALAAEDGDDKWEIEVDSRIVASNPRVYRNTLFVGSYEGKLYAIDLEKEQISWKYATGGSIFSTPVFLKGNVFIGSTNGSLYALNVSNGKLVWKYATGDKIYAQPEYSGNSMYITSGNNIFALNPYNGSLQWQYTFKSMANTPVTARGNHIYVGLDDGAVFSLRSSLKIIVK